MKKDLTDYLLTLQSQRDSMRDILSKVKANPDENAEGVKNLEEYVSTIDNNFLRVQYCEYLVHLPPKFIQKLQAKRGKKEADRFAKANADKDSVEMENTECLNKMKDLVNEES